MVSTSIPRTYCHLRNEPFLTIQHVWDGIERGHEHHERQPLSGNMPMFSSLNYRNSFFFFFFGLLLMGTCTDQTRTELFSPPLTFSLKISELPAEYYLISFVLLVYRQDNPQPFLGVFGGGGAGNGNVPLMNLLPPPTGQKSPQLFFL